MVLLIAIVTLSFYLYKSFPDTEFWETPFFKLRTNYGSWFTYAWYVTSKVVPLTLLLIWFFTCKHWWHWIIIAPIGMYAFQLWSIIRGNTAVDEIELIYIIPMMMVLIPAVYLVRAKLFAKIRGKDLKAFEEDLGKPQNLWQQIKDLFQ
ncbi:MAG: hypothetical protein H6583_07740 [Alteromonas sp.]|nr:hypothetical protein [Flavobacteriaceae bacterium]MCB9213376.1 hypothetical protein [Alteromonas sp.]